MTASKPHSEQDYDLANAVQGLKGCDAIYSYDVRRAYEGLHRWAELLIEDRKRLEEQLEAERQRADDWERETQLRLQEGVGHAARARELQEQLERAEKFIAKQGMEYRFAEFCGGVANPAERPS